MDATNHALVGRVIAGELAAFSALMHMHGQRVYRIVRGILRDDADAQDACQDVWLRAYGELTRIPEGADFSTWVSRLALRVALARLPEHRGLASLHGLDRDAPDVTDPDAPDGDPPETRIARMERAIDEMRPSYSTVVLLRYVESLTTRETAAVLGLGEENVHERLARARGWLRDQLGAEIGDELRDVFRCSAECVDALVGAVMRGIYSAGRPRPTTARTAGSRPRFAGAGRGRHGAQTERAWSPHTTSTGDRVARSMRRRTNSSSRG